ncbi:hypothetical protein CHS0354_028738 [Potamilus streckersoni]|uniref:Tetraspanin n=1 Tax=Potamilus streckersoni TaxID=2493646 RepID=A0AAE0VRC9_9BIVA|nr:hypothetical protein CHS0354_028738 [Potamilus streckersoni]
MGFGMGRKRGSAFCVVKVIFIVFNIIVWLLGFGVLTVGIWMQVNRGSYVTLMPYSSILSASALCITASAIIFIIGFCGCCGAMVESQCMLVVYFVFVLIVFGLQVAATALGLSHKQEIQRFVERELLLSIQEEYDPSLTQPDSQEGIVAIVDAVQQDLECCGLHNYTDWFYIPAWPEQEKVPLSCCREVTENCIQSSEAWYTKGCMKEIEYFFMQNMYTLGILALAAAVIQVLAMSAAVSLFCCLRKDRNLL